MQFFFVNFNYNCYYQKHIQPNFTKFRLAAGHRPDPLDGLKLCPRLLSRGRVRGRNKLRERKCGRERKERMEMRKELEKEREAAHSETFTNVGGFDLNQQRTEITSDVHY